MNSGEFGVAAHFAGVFDAERIRTWVANLRTQLAAPDVTLGLLFVAPKYFDHAQELLEIVRVHARVRLLAGCSSPSLVAGEDEFEGTVGFVLGLYHFPGGKVRAHRFTQEQVEDGDLPGYWPRVLEVERDACNGWLVFADPFHLDAERWLQQWNRAFAPLPIVGGLATGEHPEPRTQVYLDGEVFEEGGVAVSFHAAVGIESMISQGCTPIGETWTITKTDRNFIHQIGSQPAYKVLNDTFHALPHREQTKARGNLFVGLVIDEYREEFHRGDFLVRNLIGADPSHGSIAVGALPRVGQTLQFQRRDASAATEDMNELLERTRERIAGRTIYGGCLCSCNGRGENLFGVSGHDSTLVQQKLGPMPLAGFFCNGEIGPVGDRSFLHGYTASLALFVNLPQPKHSPEKGR
jgi:small ligand-binding sensory domain FIST